MPASDDLRERIIDAALSLAEPPSSWDALRLHQVATRLGLPLAQVWERFRDKEAIAEAWFDRADAVMLGAAQGEGFVLLTPRQRLARLLMAWLEALAPHRGVALAIVRGRLAPGRLQAKLRGASRVRRTVRWLREAAGRDAGGIGGAAEESFLTGVYLSAFLCWMYDASPGAARTRRLVERSLATGEQLDRWLCAGRPRPGAPRDDRPASEEPTL